MLQSVSHQILQSPARLGLPNPNSPSLQSTNLSKFSSQNPQTLQPNPLIDPLPTPSVSSTLLPLLPPLPRAQSLLLQMASLASKLFEVSPNRAHWISAFRGSLPSFLSSQMQSPSPSPSTESYPSSARDIVSQFKILQTQLFEAVAELQEILDLQDAKQKVAREIRNRDSALLLFANRLMEAENVLDTLVDDYSDYRRPKRTKPENDGNDSSTTTTTVATQLKLSDIMSYAHKISYTTFAPPEFGAGQAPLRGALPPAPQEEQMRASQLYNVAELDIGLPKTEKQKETIAEPFVEIPVGNALQGLVIPQNIVVPSGWKPGMPVELSSDLPILPPPPPGWKPGDPVTLPPLDSLPRNDEQKSKPAASVPPPQNLSKPSESIQVRHVQLDIDDGSSDYSSDIGSSDSED